MPQQHTLHPIKWLLIISLLLATSACQSFAQLEKPDVKLASLQMIKAGLFEQQWDVGLRVSNPNQRKLTLETLDYTLYLNDQKVATGMNHDPISLPARDDALVHTTITTNLFTLLQRLPALQKAANNGKIPYRVEGEARLDSLFMPIHFDHNGEVAMPDLEQLLLR